MPASQEQKVDFLLKKIGYSASKTGIAEDSSLSGSTKKAPFAEAIASPLVIPSSTIWSESGLIPATPPSSNTAYVGIYTAANAYRMTFDNTVGAARRTFIARSSYGNQSSSIDGDWIDTQFGADYIVQVYKGDPNSGGVSLQQAGANAGTDGWFFDYSSGVLNFNGTNLPSGIGTDNVYILGYRYIGRKGVQPEAGIGTFHDLVVSNNLSVGGISTLTGQVGFGTHVTLQDDAQIRLGEKVSGGNRVGDFIISHDTSMFGDTYNRIDSTNGNMWIVNRDTVKKYMYIRSNDLQLRDWSNNFGYIHCKTQQGVDIFYNNERRFQTTGVGATIFGTTQTQQLNVSGVSTFNGIIEATAGQNKIPSLYNAFSDLPNAGTYHGLFAHVHEHGRGYFAHGGAWYELVNKESNGVVGTGTESYNIGSLVISGVTTSGNIGISTGVITGPSVTYIDPATVGDDTGTLVIKGDLQVEGTQTVVNSSTMTVTDKNIELAKGAANDAAADGGGITVDSGDGDKTWQWVDATDSWTSSEHIRIPDNKVFGFASDTNTFISRPSADTIAFNTNGNERLRIASGGGIGIGTTNPAAPLHISGPDAASARLLIEDNNNGIAASEILVQNGGRDLRISATNDIIFTRVSGGTPLLYLENGQNVGIGTEDPDAKLDVFGNTKLRNDVDINGNLDVDGHTNLNADLDVDGHTELDNVNITGFTTFATGTRFYHHTPRIEMQGNSTATLSFVNNTTGTTTNDGMLMGFSSSSASGFINVLEGGHGFILKTGGSALGNERINISGLGTVSLRYGTTEEMVTARPNGAVELYHDGTKRLETSSVGVSIPQDLDVDGHTNLDNVSVAGVSTFSGNVIVSGTNEIGIGTNPDNPLHIFSNDDGQLRLESADNGAVYQQFYRYNSGTSTRISYFGFGGTGNGMTLANEIPGGNILFKTTPSSASAGAEENALQIKEDKSVLGYGNLRITGVSTFTGAIDANGDLDVDGHTELDNVNISGVVTATTLNAGNSTFTGTINAGNTVGSNGYYLKSTGIGVTWQPFPVARTTQTFTASGGQTTFSFTYNVNYIDVFVNGTKLTSSEFTATNGTSVVLAVGCFVGDIVDLFSYNVVASGGGLGLNNIVEDVTPQLGGNLDLFNKTITGTGNINMTGVATATKFVGDGSGLTGIVASGSGVVVKDNGSAVGTAGTINFGTNLDVSNISAGIVTVTAAGISTANITSESITSESLRVTGVTTFVSKNVHLGNSSSGATGRLNFGSGNPLQIFYDSNTQDAKITKSGGSGNLDIQTSSGSVDIITGTTNTAAKFTTGSVQLYRNNSVKLATTASGIDVTGTAVNDGMVCAGVGTFSGLINANANIKRATGNLDINASNIVLKNAADSATYASFNNGGNVELHFNNVKRFETTNTGAVVAGIMTATSFVGDGSGLENISGVGTDNVRTNTLGVVGVSTFSGNVELGPTSGIGITFNASHGSGQFTGFVTSYSGVEIQKTGGDFRFKDEAGNQLGAMQGESSNFGFFGNANGNGRFDFYTGNDYRMRIQPGGDINVGTAATINGITGNATYAGIVTAANFVGDGSGLTGVVGSGSGIVVQHDGSNIGTAGTINFSTNLDVSAISAGIVTVTASNTQLSTEEVQDIVGAMFSSNTETNITATYQDSDGTIDLIASGGGADVGITTNLSGTFTASAGTPSTINTFTGYSSDDLVVEYTVYIKNGSDFQTQKLLAMRDGTTIHSTQFAVMFSSSLLVQCDATISSGNILLRATPETGVSGSTTYKVKREVM